MKRLFYIRHGQTVMNAAGQISGRKETPLTNKGIAQAKQVGKRLKRDLPPIDLILASPLERTYQTAQLIAGEIGYDNHKILLSQLLIERTFGVLDGTFLKDFLDHHDYLDFDTVAGAETIKQLDQRAAKAFVYLQKLQADTILVVGHASFGRAIRRVAKGLPYTDEYENYDAIDNAAIIKLV